MLSGLHARQVFKHLLDVLLPFSHHRMDASVEISLQAELASSLTVCTVLKRMPGRRENLPGGIQQKTQLAVPFSLLSPL
jgi:hypothetical protein